jgi:hypothetical protein
MPGLYEINGAADSCCDSPECRPVVRRENEQRQFATREVLLISHILIAGQEQIESSGLGRIE